MKVSKPITRSMNAKRRSAVPLLSLVWMLMLAAPLRAGTADGGTQSIFSTLGAGSRGISLGRAYVSLADDASALYWNPAALRNVQTRQIMGMYMPLFGDFTDATYSYLGAVYPTLNAGAIGIGLQRVSADFDGYDQFSVPLGKQGYSETQVLVGWAFERDYRYLGGRLATGISFKIANQSIADASSTSPGIDLGFRYIPDFAKPFSVGLNVQDLVGPDHRLFRESDETDRTLMLGIGFTHLIGNGSAIRLMMQLDSPERADNQFHVGAEYAFARYVSLRAGFDDGDLTFGLGVAVSSFGLDYAYLGRETAGSSRPVSFTAHGGRTLYEQRELLAEERRREEEELIANAFATRVESHRQRANEAEAQDNLPVALDEWKIVLEYVPGDVEAAKKLEALTREIVAQQEAATRNIENQARISAHFRQGLRFYQQSDYVRAREEWRQVLAIDSTHSEASNYARRTQIKIDEELDNHIVLAGEYEQQGRLTEAIGEWNNVQLLDPGNPDARAAIERIRARIESQGQDLRQRERQLRIVSLYDTSLQAFNQGEYQKAIHGLEELLRLDRNHKEARNLHAMAKRKLTPLSKDEEAEIRALYLRGMEFFSKDQYSEAIREWEQILKIDPTNESVKRNIEEARERLKQIGSR